MGDNSLQSQLDQALAPCPFCGGEPFDHAIEPHTHSKFLKDIVGIPDHGGSHVVECGCGAGFIADTKAEVFALWNRRAAVGDGKPYAWEHGLTVEGQRMPQLSYDKKHPFGKRGVDHGGTVDSLPLYASPTATAQAVAWVSSEAASLLRKLPSCAAAFRSFDVNAASVKRDDRSVPIYLQPPATVDVGALSERVSDLLHRIEGFGKAYPTDMFSEVTTEEREWLHATRPGLMDRIAASMGRHVSEKIADDLASIRDELAALIGKEA